MTAKVGEWCWKAFEAAQRSQRFRSASCGQRPWRAAHPHYDRNWQRARTRRRRKAEQQGGQDGTAT